MRRRYIDADYIAAFTLLGVVFLCGFFVGILIAWAMAAMI